MGDLKMPELNHVLIAGNLTRDPIYRQTSTNTPVVNFSIASNRKYRDGNNAWAEDVTYVGVVAWNRLAESCKERLRKGSAVLVDGELQSRSWRTDDGHHRSIVEIRANRIQFLNKYDRNNFNGENGSETTVDELGYEDNTFNKFLSDEESELLNNN